MTEYIVEIGYHFPAWRNKHPNLVHAEPTWWPVVQVLEHHLPHARVVNHPWFAQYLVCDTLSGIQTGITADWNRDGCRVKVSNTGKTGYAAQRPIPIVQRIEASLRTLPGFYKEEFIDPPMHTDGTPLTEILECDHQLWLEEFVEKRRARDDALKRQAR